MTKSKEILFWSLLKRLVDSWRGKAGLWETYTQIESADLPILEEHILTLQQYLSAKQIGVNHPLILGMACLAPGLYRGITPQLDCLKLSRGGFSEARLEEATQAALSLTEALITGEKILRRMPIAQEEFLSFVGLPSLATIKADDGPTLINQLNELNAKYGQATLRETIIDRLKGLTKEEMPELAAYAFAFSDWLRGEEELSLLYLAIHYPEVLQKYHSAILKKSYQQWAFLFREAGPTLSTTMMELIREDRIPEVLKIMAWQSDENIVALLKRWREMPPKEIGAHTTEHINTFTEEAGWVFDKKGRKRQLYNQTCISFDKYPKIDANKASSLVLQLQDKHCPWCHTHLVNLFTLEAKEFDLLPIPEGQTLTLTTCLNCSAFTTVYFEMDREGNATWSTYNQKPDYLRSEPKNLDYLVKSSTQLVLSSQARNPYEAISWTQDLVDVLTQVGGFPTWIQECDYPACPKCEEKMPFVGQVAQEDVAEAEGIYYAFLCRECRISAVNYQQT